MRTSTIRSLLASAAVLAAVIPLSRVSWAQAADPPSDQPGQQQPQQGERQGIPQDPMSDTTSEHTMSQLMSETATVQKIDKASQTVTLKNTAGSVTEFKAGPNVNLDRLKVGDMVSASYYEEVAVSLKKPSQGAPSMTQKTTQRNGVAVKQTTLTARVLSVDANKNTVMVQGPRGTSTLHVQDPDVQAQLKNIKAGDNVEVTYTQALAVSIEPKK
jgi:Cu/Ag efflux protein CusF